MKIVVDTNIIFSTLLNTNSKIGDLILDPESKFEYYSCNYMRFEIKKHWEKLKKISKLSDEQLQISYLQIVSRIKFINEELIPPDIWLQAETITSPVDVDDLDFIALCLFLKASLWTGDTQLHNGLKSGGFESVLDTQALQKMAEKLR